MRGGVTATPLDRSGDRPGDRPGNRPGERSRERLGAGAFFERAGPFTLDELAALAGCELRGEGAVGTRSISGVAPLQAASRDELSFLDNRRYLPLLEQTAAGAVICAPAFAARAPQGCAVLVTRTPYVAWAKIAAHFHPNPAAHPGIHPSAVIEPGAEIDPSAEIGAFVQIGTGARIGAETRVSSHTVIGPGVSIGVRCRIGHHVSLTHARLGARVTLHPGARIGQEGFGFAVTDTGFLTVPQLGQVVIEDDAEVGANSTIDRGSATDTVIGAGSRLDNLVQIGHNVRLGRCCIVVAQAGISGSTELEDFVTIAAQAGLIGHIRIGRKARIGAQAGVMSDVAAAADVIGSPAMPFREFFRNVAVLKRLARRPDPSADAPEGQGGVEE